jgi:TonB-linked SusC/RagA family outer membrane protein
MFAQIEQQTPFSFVYSNSDIDVERKLTYKSTGKELFEILSEVFRVESIDFQVKGNHIVLTKLRVESQKIEPSRVTGTVLDAKEKLPIPGVNVIIKNTGFGTVTNELGQFSIQIPEEKCMLVFSFIGFTPQEIDAKDKSDVVIYLVESSQLLDEVVAYAYGNENKKMLSSAISSIKTDRITDFVTPAIIESLKGKITGIAVNKNSGTPGGAMTVRIRGISSITAGADPLYIIDGIPLIAQDLSLIIFSGQGVNTISDINPADIESVSILKDASATAIYGARGSNGVFLITTKRGKNQLPKVNFHLNMGLQEVAKTYKMLNAEQFMRYRNDAAINDGGTAVYTEEQIKNNPFDTDWQKELFRVSPIENYDLSINGGNENTTYYLSGNYFNQQGIAIGTDYKRYGARFNFDQVLGKGVTVGTSLALNKSVNNRKEGDQSLNSPVAMALSRYPIYPILNTDGTYNEDGPNANPISIANQHINVAYSWHALGNVFASFKFLDGLTYKIKYGFDFVNFREHTFDPPTTRQGAKYQGLGIESTSEVQKNVISNIITYNNVIDQKHIIDLLAGSEIESENRSSTYLRGELFPSNTLEYIISAAEKISADAFANEAVINSFFGRARYNFSRKYTTTFNARFDGSSRFSTQNRYGFFPSGDFLWRISDEDFFSFEKINDLKFRVSYGITGNDKIPDFLYITRYGTAQYDGLSAIYPINIANPNLKWETTKQFNIGFDIALWEGKLTTSIDYYHKKTEDLLLNKPTPPSSGYTGIIENIGKLENKGFELSINSKNISQTLNWQTFFNISFNRNKVTELYKNQPIDNIGRGSQRIAVGEPVGFFYGYKSLGVNPLTGDIIFEDLNRDGTIDVNDKEKIGSPHPLFDGGISNVFEYKNFEADVFFQFSYGNDIFNGTRRYIEIMRTNNQSTAVLDRWMKPGDITAIPRATNSDPNENNRVSSRFVEDGSYLKLKSIKLAYSLDSKIARRWSIPKLKLYLQAQNIITWTKFSGMDPEVNYAGPDVIRSGVEFFTYPSAKIYSFGLSMEF